jgi:hypothetical protein
MTRTVEEALTEFADELRRERETNYSVSEAGMLARIEGRLRALASSPPPAAPARDDRGADLWRTLVKTTRVLRALIATKVRGDALEAWVREKGLAHLDEADDVIAKHRDAYARNRARAASSSGEATALREALRECTYLLKCAASGSPALDVPRAYAAVRDAQRALAASPSRPSQPCENEFHADACDGSRQDCHPVASPSQPEKEEHHG